MNNTWVFYDVTTGDLFPGQMNLPTESVALNTPEGHAALMIEDGEVLDWRTQRVDPETGEIVARAQVPLGDDVLESEARRKRDALLSDADGMVMRAIEQSVIAKGAIEIPSEILQYKQTLRDLPDSSGWPRAIVWPIKPKQ